MFCVNNNSNSFYCKIHGCLDSLFNVTETASLGDDFEAPQGNPKDTASLVGHAVHRAENKTKDNDIDRKSTRLNSSHMSESRMPSSA